MALNISKCKHLTPLYFKGLSVQQHRLNLLQINHHQSVLHCIVW